MTVTLLLVLPGKPCNLHRSTPCFLYPDVENSPDATLLCLGAEVFGRWHPHCIKLIRHLAKLKSEGYPVELQQATRISYANRWWSLLSVGLQKIVNSSLLRSRGHDLRNAGDAWHPPMMDVLDSPGRAICKLEVDDPAIKWMLLVLGFLLLV